jgi:hypothetical protein
MRYLLKLFTPIIILGLIFLSLAILKERKTFDIRGLTQIDPIPKTKELIKKEKYADAQEYLSYFMQFDYVKNNPEAIKLNEELTKKRDSFEYKKDKILEGILEGKSDEDIGKLSAIASDFFVIGDIRDLAIQGNNYINDKEVDNVVLALSTLGLMATASTIYSLGATAPAKDAISVLKYAKRTKNIPPWLGKVLVREAKVAKETKSLKSIRGVLNPIYELYKNVGLKETMRILKETKNLNELKSAVKISNRFGKNSGYLLKLTGGSKSIKRVESMKSVNPKSVLYASTYGEKGLIGLKRLGEAKFLIRVSKTTYKGNFDSIFNKLLRLIPDSVLFGILFFGMGYFVLKAFKVGRAVVKIKPKSIR